MIHCRVFKGMMETMMEQMQEQMCEAEGMDSMFENMAAEDPNGPSAEELKASFQSFMKESMGKGDGDGSYLLPDGTTAKMDKDKMPPMGGMFGPMGDKDQMKEAMKAMMTGDEDNIPPELMGMMGGMGGMGGMPGMDDMDPEEEAMLNQMMAGMMGGKGGKGGKGGADPRKNRS